MAVSRRAARELALKVLFQVDVGKQPLSEVLDVSLEQLRIQVNQPVQQAMREGEKEIHALFEPAREMPPQSVRHIRSAQRAAVGELFALRDRIGEVTRGAIAETPDLTPEEAVRRVQAEAEKTEEALRRIAERQSLHGEILGRVARAGIRRAREMAAAFERQIRGPAEQAQFAVQLIHGTADARQEIDRRIADLSEGWTLDRQPAVDRNILRLAAYELIFAPDIPAGATINEAVELAKRFSTAESGRFVNGVLGALAASLEKR